MPSKTMGISLALLLSLTAVASAGHVGVGIPRASGATDQHVRVGGVVAGGVEDDNASALASSSARAGTPKSAVSHGRRFPARMLAHQEAFQCDGYSLALLGSSPCSTATFPSACALALDSHACACIHRKHTNKHNTEPVPQQALAHADAASLVPGCFLISRHGGGRFHLQARAGIAETKVRLIPPFLITFPCLAPLPRPLHSHRCPLISFSLLPPFHPSLSVLFSQICAIRH